MVTARQDVSTGPPFSVIVWSFRGSTVAYLLNTRVIRILDRDRMAAKRTEGAMAKAFSKEVAHDIADAAI